MVNSALVRMTGRIRRWVYRSDDETFAIASFAAEKVVPPKGAELDDEPEDSWRGESDEPSGWSTSSAQDRAGGIVLKGDLGGTEPGERVEVWGKWVQDSRYTPEWSLKVNAVLSVGGDTTETIVLFFSSTGLEGIGPEMARRVGEYFGEDLPRVMEESPERLSEVPGIGPVRAAALAEGWVAKAALRKVFSFFARYGISGSIARRAFERFGPAAVRIVESDPFQLLDVRGIGFQSAELVARACGMEPWSVPYLKGAVRHLCHEVITQQGHTAVVRHVAASETVKLVQETLEKAGEPSLPPPDAAERFETVYAELVREEKVVEVDLPAYPVLIDPTYLRSEQLIALLSTTGAYSGWARVRLCSPEEAYQKASDQLGIALSTEQRDAVLLSLTSPRGIVTGGPGTGKTTVLKAVVLGAEAMGMRVGLCAPTGKAAKRMQQLTGRMAMTVHRLLEYSPRAGGFSYGAWAAERPLDGYWPTLSHDLLVVDEASMLDAHLACSVISAAKQGAHVLLVGDFDQLPSVGPGNVLGDLLASGEVPAVWLTEVFRQDEGSGIVQAAHRVLRGEPPANGDGFDVLALPAPSDIVDHYLALPRKLGCNETDVQILCPTKRGDYGVDNLNAEVQRRLTARNPQVKGGRTPLYLGDRVVQLRNNYDLGVVNGDVGYLREVTEDGKHIIADFDGVGELRYPRGAVDDLAPAYALTVHKSQGSEYVACVVVLHRSNYRLLQRAVLYTAITRARSVCSVFASHSSLRRAVESVDHRQRVTVLPHEVQRICA